MRLAFLWHAEFRTQELLNWADGLYAALQELGKEWEVRIFVPYGDAQVTTGNLSIEQYPRPAETLEEALAFEPDAVLCWGGLDRPLHALVRRFGKPTALCFAGGPPNHANLGNFDLVFCETDYHLPVFQDLGVNVRKAFGVNTDIFRPTPWQKPHFKAIMPAAFALYKRYPLFADAFGAEGLAVGQVQTQPDGKVWEGEFCHEVCLDKNVAVIPRIMPYYMMPYMYGLAECTVLTSTTYGGCDRTVLESLACDRPVVICDDNEKLKTLAPNFTVRAAPEPQAIRMAAETAIQRHPMGGVAPKWVVEHFSHLKYAEQLRDGILSIT